MSEAPRVLYAHPNVVVASWRGVFLEDFRRPTKEFEVRGKYAEQLRFMRAARGKTPVLSVVRPDAVGALDGPTRAAIAELSPTVDEYSAAVALVLLATGFSGAVVRGVIASAMLVRRVNYPAKVHDTVTLGAQWIAPYTTESASALEEAHRALSLVVV